MVQCFNVRIVGVATGSQATFYDYDLIRVKAHAACIATRTVQLHTKINFKLRR